jgi:guanylate kinase
VPLGLYSQQTDVDSPPMPPATKTPTKPTVAAPERSLVQRMEALQRANEIRTRRAQLKRDLKGGRMSIHDLLLEPPEYVETAKVFDMLLAVPKYGRVKVNKVLQQCRISPSKTIGGLSQRQRTELVSMLRGECAKRTVTRGRSPRVVVKARGRMPPGADLPRVFVITGPSGVGKGTLIRTLLERVPELELSVSATTRRPRLGETHGVDYHFLDDDEFERRVRDGEFVEHAAYSGRRYGTLRSDLVQRLARGAPVVLEIEVQGARQVAETMPEAERIFIAPPSDEALRNRLIGRGTDSPEDVEERLATAREEMAARKEFPHVVVNDRLDDAVTALEELVRSALASDATKPTEDPS